jgi:hypothetical protein
MNEAVAGRFFAELMAQKASKHTVQSNGQTAVQAYTAVPVLSL